MLKMDIKKGTFISIFGRYSTIYSKESKMYGILGQNYCRKLPNIDSHSLELTRPQTPFFMGQYCDVVIVE